MNSKIHIALAISTALLVSACGGGGSNDNNGAGSPAGNDPTYLVKGTVPGTLIEAYCDNGSTYSTSSNRNGTNKHPFVLELPKNLPCRLVMITNEDDPGKRVVTPIKLIDSQGNSSIAMTSSGDDIDLGHVDLSLTRGQMYADDNDDGVEDYPKEVRVNASTIKIIVKSQDKLDDDHDGIINLFEDDDGDRLPNYYDDDDDNDGIRDRNDRDHNNDGVSDNDLDGDGIPNRDDVDDDNDGIPDYRDNDDDNDGIPDDRDNDDDNDSIPDDRDEDNNDRDNGNDRDNDNDRNNGNGNSSSGDNSLTVRSAKLFPLPVQYIPDNTGGRMLTAQCAQCHGTNGYSVSRIDGLAEEAYEIVEEMAEKRAKPNYHIMNAQAKGYTRAEDNSIYQYMRTVVSDFGRGGGNDD